MAKHEWPALAAVLLSAEHHQKLGREGNLLVTDPVKALRELRIFRPEIAPRSIPRCTRAGMPECSQEQASRRRSQYT